MNRLSRFTLLGTVAGLLFTSLGVVSPVSAAPTAKEHRGRAAWHITHGRQHRVMQLHHLRRARYHRRRGEHAIESSHEQLASVHAAHATRHAIQARKHVRAAQRARH